MARCTLIYPGLLGPDVPLEELSRNEWPDKTRYPALSLLLNRGQVQAVVKQPLEAQFLRSLGYMISAEGELPIAAIRQATVATSDAEYQWCLDPVYVQIDREMAYLAAAEELALSDDEARQLIASINQHFNDALHIHYHNPQQWLTQMPWQLATHTLSEAMLQDLHRMQPTGNDARRWRSLLNEIQMLLHTHPVNVARVQEGKLPANSLWLWGGGRLETMVPIFTRVYANDALVATAAAYNGIPHAALPARYDANLFAQGDVLIILSDQLRSIQQKDVYGWLAALQHLEQQILMPLLALLRKDKLEQLVVVSDTLQLTLNKKELYKWWRRHKGIDVRILEFRKNYGH